MVRTGQKIILITGSDGGFGNLGDEFILDSVKHFYREFLGDYRIIILKHILPTGKNDGFEYVLDYKKNFEELKIDIADIQLAHYYGGGYLNHYWYEDKIWLYRYLMEKGFAPEKVVFTGQGLGPFQGRQLQELRGISKKAGYFGVRDLESKSIIPSTDYMFDDTASLAPIKEPRKLPFPFRRGCVALNVRPNADYVGMSDDSMVRLVRHAKHFAQSHKLKLVFFNMVLNHQYDEAARQREIIEAAGIKSFTMIPRPSSYKQLYRFVGNARLVVTTSFHATLASLYNRTPVCALYGNEYYRLKFEGLKASFESSQLAVGRIDRIEEQEMARCLRLNSPDDRQSTTSTIVALRQKNAQVYAAIRSRLR